MTDELIELPEGWAATNLESIVEDGKIGLVRSSKEQTLDQGFPYIRMQHYDLNGDWNFKDLTNVLATSEEACTYGLQKNDVLFNTRNSYELVGKVAIWENEEAGYLYNNNLMRLRFYSGVLPKWIVYQMMSPQFRKTLETCKSATTSVCAIYTKDLNNQQVLLPPLNEQKRIVIKIEELRDRHQTAKQALEAVPKLCDRFRQSVLAAAFRGDLTADWREENPDVEPAKKILNQQLSLPDGYQRLRKQTKEGFTNLNKCFFPQLPETWKYSTVQELYDKNFILDYADGNHGSLYPRKEEFGEEGVLYITASQIADGKVDFSSCSRLSFEKAKQLVKGWAQGGDVLLTHNATVGRTALVEDEVGSFLLGTSVTFYRTNYLGLNNVFLYLFLSSQLWQQQLHAVMAQTTRNQVSIQKQAFFLVPIPPIKEQLEVVKQVRSLLGTIQKIEQQYEKAEANFAFLNQAILAKAFRGELVEQDPNDEPASVLLDRIRAEREQAGAKPKGRRGVKV